MRKGGKRRVLASERGGGGDSDKEKRRDKTKGAGFYRGVGAIVSRGENHGSRGRLKHWRKKVPS
jgi:hypothetical protein